MKINKMTEYAIRIIRTIYEGENELVTTEAIAGKESLSTGIVTKTLTKLNHSGIVESHRGRGGISGGFTLLKHPKEISLLDLIEIMEGKLELNRKIVSGSMYFEVAFINQALREILSQYNVGDLTGCK